MPRPPVAGVDQVVAGDAELGQVLVGQVGAAPVEVLGDVADEVGELEGEAELPGRLAGRGRVGAAQDRQHHGADDRRRALHVVEQVVVGRVRGDGQVHRHALQERREVVPVQVEDGDGVQHGRQQRVVDRRAVQAGHEPAGPVVEPGGPLGRRQVLGAVDDLVGVAGEAVEGVHMSPFPGGQQPGGEIVGAAVAFVQLTAAVIGSGEIGVHRPSSNIDAPIDATRTLGYARHHGQRRSCGQRDPRGADRAGRRRRSGPRRPGRVHP